MTAATAAGVGVLTAAAGTAASVGMNLSAAAKQSKAQSAAEQAAADAAKKAEQAYQQEFAGGVQLPMEAYQQAGREGTAQQMQALQALQEADSRSLAAGVGKVQAAATEAQAGITEQMRQDLFSLESAQMEEKMANRDQIAKMNQERAMGAQAAAANAEMAKSKAYAGIGSSIAGLGEMALKAAPLYGNTADAKLTTEDQNRLDASLSSITSPNALASDFATAASVTAPKRTVPVNLMLKNR